MKYIKCNIEPSLTIQQSQQSYKTLIHTTIEYVNSNLTGSFAQHQKTEKTKQKKDRNNKSNTKTSKTQKENEKQRERKEKETEHVKEKEQGRATQTKRQKYAASDNAE